MKNAATPKRKLATSERKNLLEILKNRFEKNPGRHKKIQWADVEARLNADEFKLWSLNEMEKTGGEPDVVEVDKKSGGFIFYDCSIESPKGRRSICYDEEGKEERKEFKPEHTAVCMAADMGIELLNEEQYRYLQTLGKFDQKTSSWLATPAAVRKLGGAIFGDYRYGRVFIYHNGAQSYYAGRGFRGSLNV